MNFNPAAVIHVKTMEWTNDDALELIEQYRGHTELWNRADPKYKDKLCRFRAWSEIAERFGCSKAEVERKMNVLLTQYRREKHKMLVKLYQGIQPNPSKWYAFKRFDFMEAGGGSAASSSIDRGGGGGGSSATNGHHTTGSGGPLNGLAAAFETSAAAAAAAAATTTSHHRRMKSKEMKYFGAMGLNLPMLIANSQTLDTWNTVGQFSPPIGERNHLRVPLPMPFSASQNDSSYANAATRSLFGSSNSDLTSSSPQKPMDTTDIDEKDEKPERPPLESTTDDCNAAETASTSTERAAEGGSSPIPNTNIREAHKNQRQRGESRDQDDLDIKQELVDFFHVPHPPAQSGSTRSYSSTEDNHRLGGMGSVGGVDSEDFAQDLRVSAAAAAAAAAKGIDFGQFVLPPRNLRRSSDSLDEKYSPLNMRKLTGSTGVGGNLAAGQMLMNSLMSNESASDDNGSGRGGKNGASQDAAATSSSAAAAAAAAALYAESLNRDDCDFIGSNVSLKLRSMDRTQRIIAEKLISEVLFYGQFSELERSARIQPK